MCVGHAGACARFKSAVPDRASFEGESHIKVGEGEQITPEFLMETCGFPVPDFQDAAGG